MKLIKSKLLQKCEGHKRGKYLITLEVTDHDIEMLEDLTVAHCSKYMNSDKAHAYIGNDIVAENATLKDSDFELEDKYQRFLDKTFWKCFHVLWRKYDK